LGIKIIQLESRGVSGGGGGVLEAAIEKNIQKSKI
jgi:hypothetical protein